MDKMTPLQNTQSTRSPNISSDLNNQGIKEYRKQQGITRTQLCNRTGIPYRTLQKWETGERHASPYVITMVKEIIWRMAHENASAAGS